VIKTAKLKIQNWQAILFESIIKDQALDPPYSTGTLQRYIKFAKTLKPEFSPEAQKILVEEYCKLRKSDSFGKQQSYRITVRQLESIIRLSEGLARLHLETVVHANWVHESARLLRKSIMTIEADDIVLENPGLLYDPVSAPTPTPTQTLSQSMDVDEPVEQPKKSSRSKTRTKKGKQTISIPAERYNMMVTLIVRHMRQLAAANPDSQGLKQSEIVSWFVENYNESAEGDEDLQQYFLTARAVVSRMVSKDGTLIVIRDDKKQDRRLLALNPNCTL